jgi:hypothetical protein
MNNVVEIFRIPIGSNPYLVSNYKSIIRSYLLSDENINSLISHIPKEYKLSKKAESKCPFILSQIIENYIDKIFLDRDDYTLEHIIQILNDKTYQDFQAYLSGRYSRSEVITHDPQPKHPAETMIILTEKEKNQLLQAYGINVPKKTENIDPSMIAFLLSMMHENKNLKVGATKLSTPDIIMDEILDDHQLKTILHRENVDYDQFMKRIGKQPQERVDNDQFMKGIDKQPQEKGDFTANTDLPIKNITAKSLKKEIPDQSITSIPKESIKEQEKIDLDNLTRQQLPLAERRIKELISLKELYLNKKDQDKLKEIEEEKMKIIEAVKKLRKEYDKEIEEENRTNLHDNEKRQVTDVHPRFPQEDNVEYLDLSIDATKNYMDQKNIIIKFKDEKKITSIILVDYFVPFNPNNISRFNNNFFVYFDNRVHRLTIPIGKYEIGTLLDYIKGHMTFLDFQVNDDNIITISNLMGATFDILIETDSIFPYLGFNQRENYKNKVTYSASVPFNLTSNEKVFFSLAGSSMDAIPLEFNKTVTLNKVLKKSTFGIQSRQMILKFTNAMEHFYDFVEPFKICFKMVFAKTV